MSKYGEPARGTNSWDVPLKSVFDNIETDVDTVRSTASANTAAIAAIEVGAFSAFTDETNPVSKTGTREITITGADVTSEYVFRRAILVNGLTSNLNHVVSSELVGSDTVVTVFEDIVPATVTTLKKGIVVAAVPLSENRPVAKPSITTPTDGATDVKSVTLTATDIRLLYGGDTLANTTFWLTSDAAGETIVYGPTAVAGTSLVVDPDDLTTSTTYYAFCTQESSAGDISLVSDAISFTTSDSFFSKFVSTLGGSGTDYFEGIAADDSSKLYAAGQESTSGVGGVNGLVSHVDSSGAILWQKRLGGSGTDYFSGVAAISSNAGCILAGRETSSSANVRPLYARVDNDGSLAWQRHLTGSSDNNFIDVCIDSLDNGYAAGSGSNSGTLSILIAKFNSSGAIQWKKDFSGAVNVCWGCSVDSSDNMIIVGQTNESGAGDGFVAKVSSAGALSWARRIGGASLDVLYGAGTDSSNNVYAVGKDGSTEATEEMFIVKYNSSGTLQWQRKITSAGNSVLYGSACDTGGNVYVTGNDGNDGYIAKLDSSGAFVWQRSLGGSGTDFFSHISSTPSTGFYLAGREASTTATIVGLIATIEDDASGATGTIPDLALLSWSTPTLSISATALTEAASILTLSDSTMVEATPSLTFADTTLTYTKSDY